MDKNDIAGIGIVAVTVLEGVALSTGHDGMFFGPAIAGISGMVGLAFGLKLNQKGGESVEVQ